MGTEYAFKLAACLVDALSMAQQLQYVVINPDNYEVGSHNWVVTNHRSTAIAIAELLVAEDVPFEFKIV